MSRSDSPTTLSPVDLSLRARIDRLREVDLAYIPNAVFAEMRLADELKSAAASDHAESNFLATSGAGRMPAHLERLCSTPLLSPEEERELFCRMNFLRSEANAARAAILQAKRPRAAKIAHVEQVIDASTQTRNEIVRANVRLVISIVKGFADDKNRFDDLLSEGISCLVKAVDKFDFARGFRFSTYATRAIRREIFRLLQRQHRDRKRFSTGTQEILSEQVNRPLKPANTELTWRGLDENISTLMDGLNDRERFIVSARYGFDDIGDKPTFQRLGNLLGVSKERVRQIEQRALIKLRDRAESMQLEPLSN